MNLRLFFPKFAICAPPTIRHNRVVETFRNSMTNTRLFCLSFPRSVIKTPQLHIPEVFINKFLQISQTAFLFFIIEFTIPATCITMLNVMFFFNSPKIKKYIISDKLQIKNHKNVIKRWLAYALDLFNSF